MNPPIPVRCLLNFNPRSREGSDWVFCSFPAQLNHFNPRSREGSDAFRLVVICFLSFQSTLPRGERLLLVELHACVEFYFNPRSREGSDESRDRDVSGLLLFQSTLPRGERRPSVCCLLRFSRYFNPRSREGSDGGLSRDRCRHRYFNPRSREGSDNSMTQSNQAVVTDFNPRSREGSDLDRKLVFRMQTVISIHAPARGATAVCDRFSIGLKFQSTLPRGERLGKTAEALKPIAISIHAPARGATIGHPKLHINYWNFNPRSREGSDCKNTQTTNIISVYFYLYYIIFVSLATNTAYITITKPSKCRCESPYTFC